MYWLLLGQIPILERSLVIKGAGWGGLVWGHISMSILAHPLWQELWEEHHSELWLVEPIKTQLLYRFCSELLSTFVFTIRNTIILFCFYKAGSPAYPSTTPPLPLLSHLIMDYVKGFTEVYYSFQEALQLEPITEFHLKFSMIVSIKWNYITLQSYVGRIIVSILFLILLLIMPCLFWPLQHIGLMSSENHLFWM